MIGFWDSHDTSYGLKESYRVGGQWLDDCDEVEDWGCGPKFSKRFIKGHYVGVDGSGFPDVIADLTKYTASVDGIFMRHVLEHNHNWQDVLKNAVNSFQRKMSLIMFRGDAPETRFLHSYKNKIPFYEISDEDIRKIADDYIVDVVRLPRKKRLHDTVYLLKK